MPFTKEQAIEAKYYLQRTGECALLAFHAPDSEEWLCRLWLGQADEAFKKAATALGYLIEPIGAAERPESEAGAAGTAPATSSSSARGGFAVEGQ